MERGFRFRVSGLIFLLVLALHLLSAGFFNGLFLDQSNEDPSITILQVLVAAGLIIFASDSIGFVFSSIAVCIFNCRGGYSGQYEKNLGYKDLKKSLINDYMSLPDPQKKSFSHDSFESRFHSYNTEHFFVYFLWHRPDMSEHLNEWIERRHTAYFTAFSTSIAIFLASVVSFIWILVKPLQLCFGNLWTLVGSIIFCFIILRNGACAMKDALAIIDFRISGFVNQRVRELLNRYSPIKNPSFPDKST